MSRISIAGALMFAALLGGAGCQAVDGENVETVRSAIGGSAGANTVGSPIRAYAILGVSSAAGTGGPTQTHAVVYGSPTNGSVQRRTGTPPGAAVSLGGNMLMDSAPWGYRRADGVDAVLYVDVNRHVHEIRPSGSSFIDLDYTLSPINAPLAFGGQQNGPVPDAIGYVRAGGRSAVVYRSHDNHVIELFHNPGGNPSWVVNDLTVLSGSQFIVGKGSAFPYARSDSYNTVVYAANDAHIHELATFATPGPGTGGWGDGDLSFVSGAFTDPTTDPWGYVRFDDCNSVVYVAADGAMHELALFPGGSWGHYVLPAVSPLGGLHRRPSGYLALDAFAAVAYVGADDSIHQLALMSNGWVDSVIPVPGVIQKSQLFAHLAPSPRMSILFRGLADGFAHGYELTKTSSGSWTLKEF
jgi:hypothetical protein